MKRAVTTANSSIGSTSPIHVSTSCRPTEIQTLPMTGTREIQGLQTAQENSSPLMQLMQA